MSWPARDAAADRGLHVLPVGLLAHRGPGDPGHDRQRGDRQRDRGQREVPQVADEAGAVAERREPAQLDREQQ